MKIKHLDEIKRLVSQKRELDEKIRALQEARGLSITIYSRNGQTGMTVPSDAARSVGMVAGQLRIIAERDRAKVIKRLAELGVEG
jgi:hypothetical protein